MKTSFLQSTSGFINRLVSLTEVGYEACMGINPDRHAMVFGKAISFINSGILKRRLLDLYFKK